MSGVATAPIAAINDTARFVDVSLVALAVVRVVGFEARPAVTPVFVDEHSSRADLDHFPTPNHCEIDSALCLVSLVPLMQF